MKSQPIGWKRQPDNLKTLSKTKCIIFPSQKQRDNLILNEQRTSIKMSPEKAYKWPTIK